MVFNAENVARPILRIEWVDQNSLLPVGLSMPNVKFKGRELSSRILWFLIFLTRDVFLISCSESYACFIVKRCGTTLVFDFESLACIMAYSIETHVSCLEDNHDWHLTATFSKTVLHHPSSTFIAEQFPKKNGVAWWQVRGYPAIFCGFCDAPVWSP